ncbi:MAG: hypothetical protein PHY31_01210 [Smithellaceae bacterium]|nr:hypothetical protein [Smithellaceae bacterium]
MRNVRSNLTRIKNLISQKLPEGQDVFGYAGITKEELIRTIEESSGLIDGIEGKKESFDVIVLKREFHILSGACLDYLNSIPKDYQEKEFDNFLKNLAEIRRLINNTYLLFVKEALRPESELATIRKTLEEIIPANDELKERHISTNQIIQDINEKDEIISEKLDHINKIVEEADNLSGSAEIQFQHIEEMRNSVDEWAKSIESAENDIAAQNSVIVENQKKIAELRSVIESEVKEFKELSQRLGQQLNQNEKFQTEIRDTIGDANRSSMAGSFKKRSDELEAPLKDSEKRLVLVLILFGFAALLILGFSVGEKGGINYIHLLSKLPILTPFIWLAWVYTNKVGHLSRIKEDYSFKYAAAMAFEGYKQNCGQEGSDLANRLMEVSINNMGDNPIRLYGKVQSGPIHEVLEKAAEVVTSRAKRREEDVEA